MPEPALILQTKLQIPQVKSNILPRKRIMSLLQRNRDKKLVTVCADAGYGKTTLLSQYCAELDAPFAFYSVGPADNDLITFLSYIVAAMRRDCPKFGVRVRQVLPQTRDRGILLGTFINEFIEHRDDDFYLVLDDYHHLQANREIADAVEYILKNAPTNFHMVIASRSTLPINLTHYLAKQELFQIDKEILRFTLKEIQALLKEIYGFGMPDEDVQRIERHTEGWITAIQLILQKIRMTGEERAKETLNGYLASGDEVFSYFATEVFEHQSKRIREFLLHTAVLDFLNPDTCNYLMGIRDAAKILRNFDVAHLFVTRIGDRYRYHPLFQEFLLKRIRRQYPTERIKALDNRMGAYFLKNQDYPAAISHFLLAENFERAAGVLERNFSRWLKTGELENYIALVDRFPVTVAERYPHLLFNKARLLSTMGRIESVPKILNTVLDLARKTGDRGLLGSVYSELAHYHEMRLEMDRVKYYLDRAVRYGSARGKKLQISLKLSYAFYYQRQGLYRQTEECLVQARRLMKNIRDNNMEIAVLRNTAAFHWAKFNYPKALEIFEEMIGRIRSEGINIDISSLYANAAMMSAATEDYEKAKNYLREAETLAENYNIFHTRLLTTYVRADLYFQQRDYARALEHYQKSQTMTKQSGDKLNEYSSMDSIAWTYLTTGKLDKAQAVIRPYEPAIFKCPHPTVLINHYLLKGRIETELGNLPAAFRYFRKAMKETREHGQSYLEMFLNAEMSRSFRKQGNDRSAVAYLGKALGLSRKLGFDYALIGRGRHDLSDIEYGLRHGIQVDYLQQILERIHTDEARRLITQSSTVRGSCDLACEFLGNFVFKDKAGQLIEPRWRTQKGKALFILLALNQPNGCTKDQLIDALWSDKDLPDAAHSLQVEISALRNLLKDISRTEVPAKSLIVYQGQRYSLARDFLIKSDIREQDELLKTAEAREPKDRDASAELLEQALALYRGEFCADITDECLESTRFFHRDRQLKILKKLGAYYLNGKEYQKARPLLESASALDEFDEAIHTDIMRCYAGIGDRKGVQKRYDILIKKLKELGVDSPSHSAAEIVKSVK